MKNKKIIIGISMLILICIVLIICLTYNKSKEIVYIKMNDSATPSNTYTLKIDDNKNIKLEIKKPLADNDKSSTIEYSEKLTKEEMEKITKIINYINEKNNLTHKDNYIFYFNQEDFNLDTIYLEILENTLISLESICMNNIEMNGTPRRLFGNTMLDNIISTQLN